MNSALKNAIFTYPYESALEIVFFFSNREYFFNSVYNMGEDQIFYYFFISFYSSFSCDI